jgi:hypothetical protein
MNKEEMLSLYDYLGRPAGSDLGKKVADAAVNEKIPMTVKFVSNPKYTGDILMYPKEWLDKYFTKQTTNNEVYELPF